MHQLRCPGCGAVANVLNAQQVEAFQLRHRDCVRQYMGLGDVVAAGIKKVFRVAPCGACERRKQVLNNMAPRVWRR